MATKTIGQLLQATTINNGDEFAIEQSGVTKRVAASVVRGDIINANIKSDAAIAYSKLAALNSAQILVGNGSNVPTAVGVTGDVTISNAGVTAIGSAKVLPAMLSQPYTLATSQASTSGTSIDFTGIPSWVKRITVMFNGVSTNGATAVLVQAGTSSGLVSTGYNSFWALAGTLQNSGTSTAGWGMWGLDAGDVRYASMFLHNIAGNNWVSSHCGGLVNASSYYVIGGGGSVSLSGALDRIRITTVSGANTFDAGSINIAYEG